MDKFTFDSSKLQNSRSLYGYTRWKNAFEIIGSSFRRQTSKFFKNAIIIKF